MSTTRAVDAGPQIVIVLTGPSGVGKDAVIDRLQALGEVVRPPTMTTRAPREDEQEAVHHYFVDREGFQRNVDAGELLEHADVYGERYGVPRTSVRAALQTGKHVVIRVDVQGAAALRTVIPGALFLALEPESIEVLRARLHRRKSETLEQLERRVAIAADEIQRARAFCVPVINVEGNLDATVAAVRAIIAREQARPDREPFSI